MEIGTQPSKGWIEVICGSMFSGKTEEFIRRIKRVEFAKQKYALFKPKTDDRFHKTKIVTRSHEISVESVILSAEDPSEIFSYIDDSVRIVGIDEAQFFQKSLVDVCKELANRKIRVIVAGLDMDFLGNGFGPIPELLAVAEYVKKVHAICIDCGDTASHSLRIIDTKELVAVGDEGEYKAVCRACYLKAQEGK